MARKRKRTVDYFPHDANASSRKTLIVVEQKYGHTGFAFWFKLLEILCSCENHYLDLNQKGNMDYLKARVGLDECSCLSIITTLSELDAIDPELWNRSSIIWSDNFITGIADAYSRRSESPPSKAEIIELINYKYPPKNPESIITNQDILPIKAEEISTDENDLSREKISGDISAFPRIKESKVKESKDKDAFTNVKAEQAPIPDPPRKNPSKKESRHFEAVITKEAGDDIAVKIVEACRQCARVTNGKFNPFQWVQTVMNKHPSAVLETLEHLTKNAPVIDKIWPYAEKALRAKDFRYRENAEIDKMRLVSPTKDEAKSIWLQVVKLIGEEKKA